MVVVVVGRGVSTSQAKSGDPRSESLCDIPIAPSLMDLLFQAVQNRQTHRLRSSHPKV